MTRMLVLSGGSLAGSFQLGVLRKLIIDKDLDFKVITGVSVGSLATAYLGMSKFGTGDIRKYYQEYENLWLNAKSSKDFFNRRCFGNLNIILGRSLYNNNKLKKLVYEKIKVKNIVESERFIRVGVVNMSTGVYHSIGPVAAYGLCERFADYVIASTSIPVIFDCVQIDNNLYADGGLRNITPLKDAFDAAPEGDDMYEIHAVLCTPINEVGTAKEHKIIADRTPLEKLKKPIDILFKTLDILVKDVYENDLKLANMYNKYESNRKKAKIYVYIPKVYPLKNSLNAKAQDIHNAFEEGYKCSECPIILE